MQRRAAAPSAVPAARRDRVPRSRPVSARVLAAGPDRLAMWAVMLGLFMVCLAFATANAGADNPQPPSTPVQHAPPLTPHG